MKSTFGEMAAFHNPSTITRQRCSNCAHLGILIFKTLFIPRLTQQPRQNLISLVLISFVTLRKTAPYRNSLTYLLTYLILCFNNLTNTHLTFGSIITITAASRLQALRDCPPLSAVQGSAILGGSLHTGLRCRQ